MSNFPKLVWNGQSADRFMPIHRSPDSDDWEAIVNEIIAIQNYIINNFLGGTNGQIGNAIIQDYNGPTNSIVTDPSCSAYGEQSIAIGYKSVATTDYSVAIGYYSHAGDPLTPCTINGKIITLFNYSPPSHDATWWFYGYDDGGLVLTNLIGGSGPTTVFASIDENSPNGGITINGSTVTLTLKEIVTNHTSGNCFMQNNSSETISIGYYNNNYGYCSLIHGTENKMIGNASYASGYNNTVSGDNAHAEGSSNTVSGEQAHAEGESNTASGTDSHAEGQYNVASGQASHAEGQSTVASGNFSHAGGRGATANRLCEWSRAESGPSKIGHLIVSGQTPNNTPLNLTTAGYANTLTIDNNSCVTLLITVSAYKLTGGVAASFTRYGQIKNVGGTLTLSSMQTIGTDINPNGWTVAFSADNTNNALQITVTGEATVDWIARVDYTQVTFT